MTDPFGMPTFVKVGKKKTPRQLPPPATPRPPTEGAQPSVGTDVTWYEDQDSAGYEHTYVSGFSAGDIIFLAAFTRSSDASATTHSVDEFTKMAGQHDTSANVVRLSVWKRIADGTESSTVTVSASGGTPTDMGSMMWFVRANGIDYSVSTPDLQMNTVKNSHDAPAVAPSHGAKDYFVFAIDGWYNADMDAAPSGYAFISDDDPPTGKTTQPRVTVAYAKKSITTSEDPGAFTVSNSAGQEPLLGTLAVLAEQDPELPAFNHTHTESDVTDLDHWTETDHDALDHTGLTGIPDTETILHGASPQSDGSLRFEYGVDTSGRPTYTAAGTTDTEAIVLLGDNGRPFAREVTL